MLRLTEYEPRTSEDSEGSVVTTDVYRDFQDWLFSRPDGFVFDYPNDKVTINGIAYRLSSVQVIGGNGACPIVICKCGCGGGGGDGAE